MILVTKTSEVCVCVFIKLHITTQSGPDVIVILCHVCVCVFLLYRQCWGEEGGALPDYFWFSFVCPADHERD